MVLVHIEAEQYSSEEVPSYVAKPAFQPRARQPGLSPVGYSALHRVYGRGFEDRKLEAAEIESFGIFSS